MRKLGIGDRVRVEPVSVGHRVTGPPATAPLVAARAGGRDGAGGRDRAGGRDGPAAPEASR